MPAELRVIDSWHFIKWNHVYDTRIPLTSAVNGSDVPAV